jgi:lipoic acid synthetase
MKRRNPETEKTLAMKKWLINNSLNTVCRSAGCPNLIECFEQSTVTFILLGNICTRHCRFCKVTKGKPLPVDPEEPLRIASAVQQLQLNHVVITSVTRDDLEDGGAGHFIDTIRETRKHSKQSSFEVLVPDFGGSVESLRNLLDADVDVFAHNVETVPRLYPQIRPDTDFGMSLDVIINARRMAPKIRIKSGMMLGLGENKSEVIETLRRLVDSGCHAITLGQYLMPTRDSYPVHEYISPVQFEEYRHVALQLGFQRVLSGPNVRSSYHASNIIT